MIKAAELRTGNIVWESNSFTPGQENYNEIEIASINDIDKVIRDSQGNGYSYDALYGIPITPDWMARCGFSFLDSIVNGRYYAGWANSSSEIAWYPIGEYISVNTSTGGEGEQPNYTELSLPHIKYLHQLQNLFFALTGEELTIKN